jgi:hypothetical protein
MVAYTGFGCTQPFFCSPDPLLFFDHSVLIAEYQTFLQSAAFKDYLSVRGRFIKGSHI